MSARCGSRLTIIDRDRTDHDILIEDLLWKYSVPSRDAHRENERWLRDTELLVFYEFEGETGDYSDVIQSMSYHLLKRGDEYYQNIAWAHPDDDHYIDCFDPQPVTIAELLEDFYSEDTLHVADRHYRTNASALTEYLRELFSKEYAEKVKAQQTKQIAEYVPDYSI